MGKGVKNERYESGKRRKNPRRIDRDESGHGNLHSKHQNQRARSRSLNASSGSFPFKIYY
jgi:hypothetical protein